MEISTKDADFKAMKTLVNELTTGVFQQFSTSDIQSVSRNFDHVSIVCIKIWHDRPLRAGWSSLYAGYIYGRKVAEATVRPGDNFVRALVRAERGGK